MLFNISCKPALHADMILLNGKIITVDKDFTIAEAVAISGDSIIAVGKSSLMKRYTGSTTRVIDLKGKTVIPGLTDSHLHPESASLSELDTEIPDVHTLAELLTWIKSQAAIKEKGSWIIFPKFFSTRLTEMRNPSLAQLDSVAPSHPVFLDGSFGGVINSAAMRVSGITAKTDHPGVLKDKKNGRPTGILRASAFGLLKMPPEKILTQLDSENALVNMLKRYNRYGITSLVSGAGDFESVKIYLDMAAKKTLTARIYQNIMYEPGRNLSKEDVALQLKSFPHVTGYGDKWVRIGPLKTVLDGGILTGTAFMQEPWGTTAGGIFGITDSAYRGVVRYTREELLAIVSAASDAGWSVTAHATGSGAVNMLIDVYGEVNTTKSIKNSRFSIIHGNFYDSEAIKKMSELGVCANMQAAWFYKDADAMQYILGKERIKSFHPYRSMTDGGVIINGGSDHMVKWDANTSINPYNPFLGMWSMVSRETERGSVIGEEEAITREEALKIYTINNAYNSFEENIKGSIEPGKLADLAVLTDDILSCPVGKIKEIEAVMTILGGKIVYSAEKE